MKSCSLQRSIIKALTTEACTFFVVFDRRICCRPSLNLDWQADFRFVALSVRCLLNPVVQCVSARSIQMYEVLRIYFANTATTKLGKYYTATMLERYQSQESLSLFGVTTKSSLVLCCVTHYSIYVSTVFVLEFDVLSITIHDINCEFLLDKVW